MNKNIFKHLRKKILSHATITEEKDDLFYCYKIECLGFVIKFNSPVRMYSTKIVKGLLIDRLVEIPEFLQKLEQIENRKDNLKSLLD